MRLEHPLLEREMDLQEFLGYPHVRLYLPRLGREDTSMVDEVLGRFGVYRTIALETTQFSAAVGVLIRTDSLLVANAGFEEGGLYRERITGRELPAELRQMIRSTRGAGRQGRMSLMRHTRTSLSPAHQWMRALLMKHLTDSGELVSEVPAYPAATS